MEITKCVRKSSFDMLLGINGEISIVISLCSIVRDKISFESNSPYPLRANFTFARSYSAAPNKSLLP